MSSPARFVVPLLLAVAVGAATASCSSSDDGTALTSVAGGSAAAGSSTSGTSTGTASGTSTATTTGVLDGRLLRVGGPAPGLAVPLRGTVTASGPGGRHTVDVGADGTWSLTLPPGRYTVSGTSPQMDDGRMPCVALAPAVVVTGTTVTADAVCSVP